MNSICNKCIFYESCSDKNTDCNDFSPFADDNKVIEEMIDMERDEFYDEWFEYINEFYF